MQTSDQKQYSTIFTSLQSNGIVKSINLNSALQSSNSKRLITELNYTDSFNNLQLSASSDNSRCRSYSQQTQRPTVLRMKQNDQSNIETIQKDETSEAKFLSISKDVLIKEFNSNNQMKNTNNLEQKLSILIEENSKLIHINEELLTELNRYKTQNSSILLNSYQRESSNLQATLKQYKQINQQQSQQIMELQKLLNEREELNVEQVMLSTNRANQQVVELESANRLINEQFTQMCTKYLLKCFELERLQLQQDKQTKQLSQLQQLLQQQQQQQQQSLESNVIWENRINQLIQENTKVNELLQRKTEECQREQKNTKQFEYILNEKNQSLQSLTLQITQQQTKQQVELQQAQKQLNIYHETIQKLENEIHTLQQQITEQSYNITRKNNDQVSLVTEISKKYELKSEECVKLYQQIQELDQKWRHKCTEFEKEMKQSYSSKLSKEIQTKIRSFTDEYKEQLLQYESTIQGLQTQIIQINAQNEQLQRMNQEFAYTLNTNNSKYKQQQHSWQKERLHLIDFIKNQQAEMQEILNRNEMFTSQYSSLGISEQQRLLKENQNLNNKVFQKCKQLMNQRFQV